MMTNNKHNNKKRGNFMNEIMNSLSMIYDEKRKIYTPKWKFDIENVSISLFRERNFEYRTISIINKYCRDHMRYLYQNDQDRIQQLLNDGTIYWYIRKKEKAANKAVDRQLEKWLKTDKEYRLAKENGDVLKEVGLYNNLKARAEEIMYPSIIYT